MVEGGRGVPVGEGYVSFVTARPCSFRAFPLLTHSSHSKSRALDTLFRLDDHSRGTR